MKCWSYEPALLKAKVDGDSENNTGNNLPDVKPSDKWCFCNYWSFKWKRF